MPEMMVPKFTVAAGMWVLLASIGAMQVAQNGIGWLWPMVVGAALSFLAAWFWFRMKANADERARLVAMNDKRAAKIAEGHDELVARVTANEVLLATLTSSVQPIATAFQAVLIKELTHFHTPEMDSLMVKLGPPSAIIPEEMARLVVLLKEREIAVDDQITDSERDAAHILPAVIKRSIAALLDKRPRDVHAVTTPRDAPEGMKS